jgi:hypothetical protein
MKQYTTSGDAFIKQLLADIDAGNANIPYATDQNKHSPIVSAILYATKEQKMGYVKTLIEKGVNVNAQSINTFQLSKHVKLVNLILQNI